MRVRFEGFLLQHGRVPNDNTYTSFAIIRVIFRKLSIALR